jgi:hypothetical protein
VQRCQSLSAGSVRAEEEDPERHGTPVEMRERRPVRGIQLDRGSRLEPVDGDVRIEEPALRRVTHRVEARPADVVARQSRLVDPLAQRPAGRVPLQQEIPPQRVHHGNGVVLQLHQPRCGRVADLERFLVLVGAVFRRAEPEPRGLGGDVE